MKRLLFFTGIALLALAATASAFQSSKTRPGWLGVSIQSVDKEIMEDYNLKDQDGALIASVMDESPADSAGLKKGDVIIEFAGRKIYDPDDLSKSVSRTKPGTKATVVLIRKGEKKNLTVVIQKQPRRRGYASFFGQVPRVAVFGSMMRNALGLHLMTLNEQLAAYFGAPNDEGVLVQEVEEKSAAEKAGLKAGDVLLRIGTRAIDEMSDVSRALDKYEEGDKVEVEVLRKGSKKTMSVEIEEMDEGPWGVIAPDTHFEFRGAPRVDEFRFDHDNSFKYEIEPKLREMEFKLRSLKPKIEIQQRELQQKIRESLRNVNRIRVL